MQSIGRLQLRGGKASALNLAARMAHGDIFILTDCDCSFEPDAIEEIPAPAGGRRIRRRGLRQYPRAQLAPFGDDRDPGHRISRLDLAGQDFLRRARPGLLRFGRIRRLPSPRMGSDRRHGRRRRRRTWISPSGSGSPGFKVVFAHRSICYTDVPETPMRCCASAAAGSAIAYWIRFRKFRRLFNPVRACTLFGGKRPTNGISCCFTGLPTLAFPFYLGWLFATFGSNRLRSARRGRPAPVYAGRGLFCRGSPFHRSSGLLAVDAVPARFTAFFRLMS